MNPDESLSPENQYWLSVWKASAPPIRPSAEDIEAMALCWISGEGARVLILGVTPELVDLALRQRASGVITMDWRAPMFAAMRCLGREDWTHVENLVCDWRTFVPQLEGALDLILGDGSLTMLAFPEEWKQVFRVLQRYLVPGGRAIMRVMFQLEVPLDLDQYLEKTLARFDAEGSKATPDRQAAMLRGLIAEVRIAMGSVSANASGSVNPEHRATLISPVLKRLAAQFGHWNGWEAIKASLPTETEIRKGMRTAKSVPTWEAAVSLMEECGFTVRHVERSGARPVPGIFRVFSTERIHEE